MSSLNQKEETFIVQDEMRQTYGQRGFSLNEEEDAGVDSSRGLIKLDHLVDKTLTDIKKEGAF